MIGKVRNVATEKFVDGVKKQTSMEHCARQYGRRTTYILFILYRVIPGEVGGIRPVLQVKKQRLRKAEYLTKSHTAFVLAHGVVRFQCVMVLNRHTDNESSKDIEGRR